LRSKNRHSRRPEQVVVVVGKPTSWRQCTSAWLAGLRRGSVRASSERVAAACVLPVVEDGNRPNKNKANAMGRMRRGPETVWPSDSGSYGGLACTTRRRRSRSPVLPGRRRPPLASPSRARSHSRPDQASLAAVAQAYYLSNGDRRLIPSAKTAQRRQQQQRRRGRATPNSAPHTISLDVRSESRVCCAAGSLGQAAPNRPESLNLLLTSRVVGRPAGRFGRAIMWR
jgi:hypothetical protein